MPLLETASPETRRFVAAALSAVAVVLTSRYMSRKTRKGRIAWERIAGLEEYIRRAEVDDIKDQERRGVFERLLPYAIVFGLSDRWGKAFADLYRRPPDWYQPAHGDGFSTWVLINDLDRSMWMMNRTSALSTPIPKATVATITRTAPAMNRSCAVARTPLSIPAW